MNLFYWTNVLTAFKIRPSDIGVRFGYSHFSELVNLFPTGTNYRRTVKFQRFFMLCQKRMAQFDWFSASQSGFSMALGRTWQKQPPIVKSNKKLHTLQGHSLVDTSLKYICEMCIKRCGRDLYLLIIHRSTELSTYRQWILAKHTCNQTEYTRTLISNTKYQYFQLSRYKIMTSNVLKPFVDHWISKKQGNINKER